MSQATRLSTLNMDGESTIAHLTRWLAHYGLRIVRGFDLQSACASVTDLTCPHHGDYPCDCQLVVLLVYGVDTPPASIVLHTHRGKTDIDLIDSPNNRPGQQFKKTIKLAVENTAETSQLSNKGINEI